MGERDMKKLPAFLNTSAGMVITVGLIILVFEYLIMALFEVIHGAFPAKDNYQLVMVFNYLDPIILTVIVSPFLYILICRPVRNQQAELERQLDDLRRFQKVTVGRELRMKELVEENAALRNQLAALQPDDTQP
jgi:hypothetical protein